MSCDIIEAVKENVCTQRQILILDTIDTYVRDNLNERLDTLLFCFPRKDTACLFL